MRYLINTHWIAAYLNGRPDARSLFTSLEQDDLVISLITYGEIYDGIYAGRDPKRHEAGFRQLLRFVDVLPVNRGIMREFARMRGLLRASGQVIGDFDTLIGATALYHGLTLVTNNRRHFGRIPGLSLHP